MPGFDQKGGGRGEGRGKGTGEAGLFVRGNYEFFNGTCTFSVRRTYTCENIQK